MNSIDFARSPNLALGATRSSERPLSKREQMQRGQAACSANPDGPNISCTGNLFVGLFFDGTGNNEERDFKEHKDDPRHQKHSNVVRLYHAYPDKKRVGTNSYFAYYAPGVGTPFIEIGDTGSITGSAAASGGEPRIIWALTRLFNAVYEYHFGPGFISDDQAKAMTEGLGGIGSLGAQRRFALKSYWMEKLKSSIKGLKPEIRQMNISVFGFSRGSAEARAFVNWFFEICEQKDGAYLFADIPVRLQFLGIFDTVASVGVPGIFAAPVEGHQSWANGNMQVHPGVERCLHMVAGHEVRACFPLDSVRIDGKYPPNAREYVYPGSHSDVGGGYMPMALGQADWSGQNSDDQIARIPGFEMYCAALAAGVPFRLIGDLRATLEADVANALTPSQRAYSALLNYYQQAGIQAAPVEDMARQHMNWYFSYRWQANEAQFRAKPQYQRALKKPNADQGKNYADEPTWLLHTQRTMSAVLAMLSVEIKRRINAYEIAKEADGIPLNNPISDLSVAVGRGRALDDDLLAIRLDTEARLALKSLNSWREWLKRNGLPEVHRTTAPEREPMWLLDALKSSPVPAAIARLFDELVHDSMAGFVGFGMPEFKFNGHGLAKFRRIYFGNRGDAVLCERVEAENEQRRSAARAIRNEISARTAAPTIPTTGLFPPGM